MSEINRRLRAGTTHVDVARWLKEIGNPITPTALGRHARHIGMAATPGRRSARGRLLEATVEAVEEDLDAGLIRPTLKDAIRAQGEIYKQAARHADRDLALKLAAILSGQYQPTVKVIDAEWDDLDDEVDQLLLPAGA